MRPESHTRPEYVAAFGALAERIQKSLSGVSKQVLPIKMIVAGGAALHFYTGERVSRDIDAEFSHRIVLPENLEVAYRDADGAARLLYLDRQYSDTLALMHEDAQQDSTPLDLPGLNAEVLDVRLLSPLDLAVSKIGRFSEQDRDDIAALARRGLIDAKALRERAEHALGAYVGDLTRTQNSIEFACRIVEDAQRQKD